MNLAKLALILLALLAATGCQRKPRFVPVEGDSTAAAVDSVVVTMRQAQERWEAGAGEEAAELSARALAGGLRPRSPSEWKVRAGGLLDSLGIGAETREAPCALLVNFFSRSNPTAGSWPYLFWCGDDRPLYQRVEGRDLHLFDLVTRGFAGAPSAPGPGRGVAALFGRKTPAGHQPILMVWEQSRAGEPWALVQTLGPDSLGGAGTGEFVRSDTSIQLIARTYRAPRYFDECAICPHVERVHSFLWGSTGFGRVGEAEVPSTYATFVRFVQLLMDKEPGAENLVTSPSLVDAALRLGWGKPGGRWRVAPGAPETPGRLEFYRGQRETYRVLFEPRGDDWLITGFDVVPRSLE